MAITNRTRELILLHNRRDGAYMSLVPGVEPVMDSCQAPWRRIKLQRYRLGDSERPSATTPNYLAALCLSGGYHSDYLPGTGHRGFSVRCDPGSVLLTGPSDLPARRSKGIAGFLVLEVPPYIFANATKEGAPDGLEIRQLWASHDQQLQSMLFALLRELLQQYPMGTLFEDHMALSFARHVLTEHSRVRNSCFDSPGKLSPTEQKLAIELINTNLEDDLSLFPLARVLKMPALRFDYAFRNSVGLHPHEYVLRRRVERALQMLKAPHVDLQTMAPALGFSSASQFSAAFRRTIGVTPSTYHQQVCVSRAQSRPPCSVPAPVVNSMIV